MTTKNFVQLDESKFPTTKGKNIDGLQAILDSNHFCSEIHCVAVKQ